ncbi:DNA-binding response regulator [Photobacterium gaetbulicola]|uniref:Two component transcriptional regulator n=1 Tax=Photobacterium gaetbulicola Gung47 TaxID=658445 RepID=A0A0C5WU27_9GAMM|nr:response regulator [Photobacterium gaetbulicola]AJR06560.1 two component transcriptional regulator [Photobacterium gaetbulicola Gung47]PSU03522.1 DNA-binding response regulator [Photobacterium gaetbulicola]
MLKIVLVEDDEKLCELLANYLRQQQFEVITVHDGLEAPDVIISHQPDLVVLDLMLPGMDGLSICRKIRGKVKSKIMILTASDDDIDHVAGLEVGGDDFVNKPIKPRVLLARIRMLLRRELNSANPESEDESAAAPSDGLEYRYGTLNINHRSRSCEMDGEAVSLTDSEFNLLWLLACHPDEVLTREFLVMETRGIKYDGLDRTIDNKIVTLRKKLGDNPSLPRKIITVRGKGYLFVPDRW